LEDFAFFAFQAKREKNKTSLQFGRGKKLEDFAFLPSLAKREKEDITEGNGHKI